jgi:tetraacyldisaccharide 4'-kinase
LILSAASSIYGAVAGWRRRWYATHPAWRRRLVRPVVSVGNLSVGGSGKTPLVACIARLLLDHGERPAILTRGYARETAPAGVTVVSDGRQVLATLQTSGDEPLMLARALPGVPVLVGRDRYAAGRVAEEELGATIHLLDDGFQHLPLERTVDLLAVTEDDLSDRILPSGHLREPIAAAGGADAVLTSAAGDAFDRLRHTLRARAVFQFTRSLGAPRALDGSDTRPVSCGQPVLAVAGIARPHRFFDDLAAAGWVVAATMAFGDHHRFREADVERIRAAAAVAGAVAVLTTEKDGVRLEPYVSDRTIAVVPLRVSIDPHFGPWLLARLSAR